MTLQMNTKNYKKIVKIKTIKWCEKITTITHELQLGKEKVTTEGDFNDLTSCALFVLKWMNERLNEWIIAFNVKILTSSQDIYFKLLVIPPKRKRNDKII